MQQTETKPRTSLKSDIDLHEPPMFKVIYLNDDKTPIEFVVSSLIEHFSYAQTAAEQTALDIHQQGSAVVAVLPYELAEQKGIEITVLARNNGFPLQIKLEPEADAA